MSPASKGNGGAADPGRFGPYGGRYVPETLIPALDELADAWEEASGDPDFIARLELL
ncbi:MAG: tryptophan synthase subunit beta, partial [Solirubrobacterales bacterium]